MDDKKVLIIIAAFIFLTGMKSLFPEKNVEIREKALEIINCRADYAALAEVMGRSLAGGNPGSELIEALKNTGRAVLPVLSETDEDRDNLIKEIILNEQAAD